ncbi:MAG: hypothetical protein K2H06_06070, partial [Anaeroplasmataceae bacterium]|nr:hypothetical protein [Anaeroplasmataceae bacterium]
MNDVKNPLLAPNKTVAVVAYFLLTLLGGSIIIIFLAMFYNSFHHLRLNPIEVLQVVSATDISKLEEAHLK